MSAAAARRAALAALIRQGTGSSQQELAGRLADQGHDVTQATVSRDLETLGAIRVKRGGRLGYALPEDMAGRDWASDRLGAIVAEWAVSAEVAGNLVIVRTRPGSAHVVASAIDGAGLEAVAGTIAGDDTLFLAVRDGHNAALLANRLSNPG